MTLNQPTFFNILRLHAAIDHLRKLPDPARLQAAVELLASILSATEELEGALIAAKASLGLAARPDEDPPPSRPALLEARPPAGANLKRRAVRAKRRRA